MTHYEIVPNELPTTLGKFHIRSIGEQNKEQAERLAYRNCLVFDTEKSAQAKLSQLEGQVVLMMESLHEKD